MSNQTSTLNIDEQGIPILIPNWVRQTARKFAGEQPTEDKANQIYRNTLAVCAVNNYLKILGMSTDLTSSSCWNPVERFAADVADLMIPDRGVLECRAITPGQTTCAVSLEAQVDRVGYVVVQIEPDEMEATLVGFARTVQDDVLQVSQLQPLDDLPECLESAPPLIYNLSQWFENVYEAGVQTVESLLGCESAPAFALRAIDENTQQRCLLFQLGDAGPSVVLVIGIQETSSEARDILLEVCPPAGQTYLPEQLRFVLQNEADEPVMEVTSQLENRNLQFEFSGQVADRFTVELSLDDLSMSQEFLI
ncbi:DUF1822 family protein [filamentous cyanobacterium LEGE 11480]|uniref:DUF1822 family protein n=1 Tax=Romeriopsis navalis LEGE 11480 TaxID=2777977 RepID=A0A928Z585_9CYAN|nr:DUF1822 family protein [Romeriopsis navalis]MBE9032554.1 DUF1822 family protein [Romeriopsis navalis LEGE 11480]